MAWPTQWTWVWVNSGSWWWTGRRDELQSMGSQRGRHDWATELILPIGASQVVLVVKNPAANAGDVRDTGSVPGSGKIPWRRAWKPIPVFLPGESHGQRSLAGYSPWGHEEFDTTERLSTYTCILLITSSNSTCRLVYTQENWKHMFTQKLIYEWS